MSEQQSEAQERMQQVKEVARMTKPVFNSKISLGNIIQIGVILIALAGAYYSIKSQSDMAARDVGANSATISSLETRVRSLETDFARESAQLGALQRDIGEIKEGQRELNSLVRQLLQRNTNR